MSTPNDERATHANTTDFSALPLQDEVASPHEHHHNHYRNHVYGHDHQPPNNVLVQQTPYLPHPPGFVPMDYFPHPMAQQYNQQMMLMMQQQQHYQQQQQMAMMMTMAHSARQMQEHALSAPTSRQIPSASHMRYQVDTPHPDNVLRPPAPMQNTMFDATPTALPNRPVFRFFSPIFL